MAAVGGAVDVVGHGIFNRRRRFNAFCIARKWFTGGDFVWVSSRTGRRILFELAPLMFWCVDIVSYALSVLGECRLCNQ